MASKKIEVKYIYGENPTFSVLWEDIDIEEAFMLKELPQMVEDSVMAFLRPSEEKRKAIHYRMFRDS